MYKDIHRETALDAFDWDRQARKDAREYLAYLRRTNTKAYWEVPLDCGFEVTIEETQLVIHSSTEDWALEVPFDFIKDPVRYEAKHNAPEPVKESYEYLEFVLKHSGDVRTKTLIARLLEENPNSTGHYSVSGSGGGILHVPDRTYGGFVKIAIPKKRHPEDIIIPPVSDGVIDLI